MKNYIFQCLVKLIKTVAFGLFSVSILIQTGLAEPLPEHAREEILKILHQNRKTNFSWEVYLDIVKSHNVPAKQGA